MNTLEFNKLETINGGGPCGAVAVADFVLIAGAAAEYAGWIAFTPFGQGLLIAAGLGLAGASLYCAFA